MSKVRDALVQFLNDGGYFNHGTHCNKRHVKTAHLECTCGLTQLVKDATRPRTSEMVREFHVAFGQEIGAMPSLDGHRNSNKLRLTLIDEEVRELHEAIEPRCACGDLESRHIVRPADASRRSSYFPTDVTMCLDCWTRNDDPFIHEMHGVTVPGDIVAVADALADIDYVVHGAALTWGIDLDAVIEEVQRSNMTKLMPDGSPKLRADGKIEKGPDYDPPRIAAVLGLEVS